MTHNSRSSQQRTGEARGFFASIGRLAANYRFAVIIFWIAALCAVLKWAPNLSKVAVSDQSGYLPDNEPSRIAARIAVKYFPDQIAPAEAVIVLKGRGQLLAGKATREYLDDFTAWLGQKAAPGVIGRVLSPVEPALRNRLLSKDGMVAVIYAGLHGSPEDTGVRNALKKIQARLNKAPYGLTGYVTGSTSIVNDYKDSALSSASRTTVISIILVILVLLVVYRSPVLPIVPLGTIALSYLISRGLVAWLTKFGWTISSVTDVFLVVLLFGAGTDYCLFLTSRFREFMADDQSPRLAVINTVARMGETITSSAGTVIVGMVGMYFAKMKLFANTGPSLALGVAVTLIAGLTLTPALMAVLGRWAFWPGKARHTHTGGIWGRLGLWVTTRPLVPLVLAIVLLVPLAFYGQGQKRSFDLLADISDKTSSKAGYLLLSKSLGKGDVQPMDIVMTDLGAKARTPQGMAAIGNLTARLLADRGVADVRSLTLPAGRQSPDLTQNLRVDSQLAIMEDKIRGMRDSINSTLISGRLDLGSARSELDTLRAYLADLIEGFPEPPLKRTALDAVDRLKKSLADTQRLLSVPNQLKEAASGINTVSGRLAGDTVEAMGDPGAMGAQLLSLRKYLAGLVLTFPVLANTSGYKDATSALNTLDTALTELKRDLLVGTQLYLMAESMAAQTAVLEDPAKFAQLTASSGLEQSLAIPGEYIRQLSEAYPALTAQQTTLAIVAGLTGIQTLSAQLKQQLLLSSQLRTINDQLDANPQNFGTDPASAAAQSPADSSAPRMQALYSYLSEMGMAFPELKATTDYQTALAIAQQMRAMPEPAELLKDPTTALKTRKAFQQLQEALAGLAKNVSQVLPQAVFLPRDQAAYQTIKLTGLAGLTAALGRTSVDFHALAVLVQAKMPQAVLVFKPSVPGFAAIPDPLPVLRKAVRKLAGGLDALAKTAAREIPGAAYIPPAGAGSQAKLKTMFQPIDDLLAAVHNLSLSFKTRPDSYFIPGTEAVNPELERLLNTYLTADGKASRLQVILAKDPFSPAALNITSRLAEIVKKSGTGYISGGTATLLDIRNVMDKDFIRVMLLVLIGIMIVLVLLLRSLVAPLYMIGTILLSYGATLGLTRLLFDAILHKDLAWWVPFFMFTLLVALGMDYNIFLMGRVKEETAGRTTKSGTARAVVKSGGIITSAGIIMAGTFGAMLSSSLLGLVELAFAITVGVLLDTFIIRTTIMPAIVVLLDKWNWWPGKGPRGEAPHLASPQREERRS